MWDANDKFVILDANAKNSTKGSAKNMNDTVIIMSCTDRFYKYLHQKWEPFNAK